MKIICFYNNFPDSAQVLDQSMPHVPYFSMKPDTAMHRNNQPYYYPDFTQDLVAEVGLIIRIDKVGRCIAPRFAPRYCGAVGVGIDFSARDILNECKAQGLPWEAAKAFDYSLPLSPQMIPIEDINCLRSISCSLKVNGTNVQEGFSGNMILDVEHIIAHVSNKITLKMGDLIYIGSSAPPYKVKIGDRLQASIDDKVLLDFEAM